MAVRPYAATPPAGAAPFRWASRERSAAGTGRVPERGGWPGPPTSRVSGTPGDRGRLAAGAVRGAEPGTQRSAV